jgi:hypothetical protein
MCWWCGFQVLQRGKSTFEFPLALPAKPVDPIVERLHYLEDLMGQLIGDDQ